MDSMHRSELTQNADASLLASRSSPYSDLVRSRCVVADEWWTTGHAAPPRWRACALPPALSPCPAAESVCKMNALGDGLVALLLDLLVGPDLLALFAQLGDALLDLLELRLGALLLGLLLLDLVAEGVELVLLGEGGGLGGLLLGLLARLLGGVHPLGARDGALAVDDRPDLRAERRVELALGRDDDDAAGKVLDGGREGAERVAVEEVGRLVEDEHVRLHPHGGGEDDLDLLAARERRDLRVGAKLRLEVERVEVLLDVERGELLGGDARLLEGDALVDLHHQLVERGAAVVVGPLLVRGVGPLDTQQRVVEHPRARDLLLRAHVEALVRLAALALAAAA